MKGLALQFSGAAGVTIAVTKTVTDFNCVAQNGMANIACSKGTDAIYPDKGTTLYKDALAGKVPTFTDAYHYSNFAALDTRFFLKKEAPAGVEVIDKVVLLPFSYTSSGLVLNASFTGANGTTIGITTTT